jgi:collagen type III alpha
MQKLHHKGVGPPLTGNNAGSPLSNPPQTAGGMPFNAGSMNPATAIKPVGGMMPPPPSPGMNKAQQNGGDKPGESGARPESSPRQVPQSGPQNPGQPTQPTSTTSQQAQQPQQTPQHPQQQPPSNQPGPGQGPPTSLAPATPSAPPSLGADPTSGLMDLQQSTMPGLTDLPWDMGDFEQTFLRQDPGDLNFERDFGQWFNPGGDLTLDTK